MVELVMAFEAGFGVNIPDATASRMATPRDVVTYLEDVLPVGDDFRCLSQRAFYQLRARCGEHLRLEARTLTPSVPLEAMVDAEARRGAWDAIGADLGCERWPRPRSGGWWGRTFEAGRPATLGEAARFAATWYPRAIKGADAGWTRSEIERSVIALLEVEAGVDMRQHTLDSRFGTDMGLD
jgi:hypothetical protein